MYSIYIVYSVCIYIVYRISPVLYMYTYLLYGQVVGFNASRTLEIKDFRASTWREKPSAVHLKNRLEDCGNNIILTS